VSFDSAPYFAALVAISCTIIDSITARFVIGAAGPVWCAASWRIQ
jgi:hypothetical protein